MKKILTLIILLCVGLYGFAQGQVITGKVTEASTGDPIPGANVVIKGTTNGTVTMPDGTYSVEVNNDAKTLVFSFVGFMSQEVELSGQSEINIALETENLQMDEVVVTALGIKREKKALGYAVEEVKGDEVANSGSSNVFTSLQGKGAGISVVNTGGGMTGSSEIVLRGANTLSGSNGALIVVDGVPFSNRSYGGGDIDFGSGIADLNPENIESISVLKGANAAALYGARALNGVVMVTTKKGKEGKARVSVSSQLRLTEIMYYPELQREYGAGHGKPSLFGKFHSQDESGVYQTDTREEKSFGAKLDEGQMVKRRWLRDEPVLPWESHGDQQKEFFQTAVTHVHNVNIDGGTEKLNYSLSMMYEDAEDVQPESTQDRYNIALRVNSEINDFIGFDGKLSYTQTETHNRPTANGNNSTYFSLMKMPPSISLDMLKPWRYGNSGGAYSGYFEDGDKVSWYKARSNPYWTIYEDQNDDVTKRIVGFGKVNFNIFDDPDGLGKLTAFARVGWDNTEANFIAINARQGGDPNGSISISKHSFLEINSDFYASYQKTFDKIGLTANVGGNRRYNESRYLSTWGNNFKTYHSTNLNNTEIRDASSHTVEQALNSLYYSVQLSYDDYLFFDITGRNDWSSTLPSQNNSFFYPSYNLGFVVTDAFDGLKSNLLEYAKLRASYAEVGNDLGAYRINTYYNYGADEQGRLAASVRNQVGNDNLVPETNKSLEFGADVRLLENRVGLDFTWYKSATEDQIIDNYPQAISTGFTSLLYNVGEISNTGIELSLNTTPVKTGNWRWDLTFNYATNEMVVEELNLPGKAYFEVHRSNETHARAYVGEKYGDIYGYRYLRDKNDMIVVNDQGYPVIDNQYGEDSKVKVGNIQADFTASIQSTLRYKNLSLSFLIDGSFGGDVFSNTKRDLNRNGHSKQSLEGREGWIYALDNDPRNLRVTEGGTKYVGSSYGGYDGFVGNSVFGVFGDDGRIMLDANGDPMTGALNEGDNAMYISPYAYWSEAARQGYPAFDGGKDGATEEFLEDATYIKLRELSLNYDLPKAWISGTGLEAVSIGVTGRNLFYLNDVSEFFDPDAYRKGTDIRSLGLERNGVLPSMRTYLFNVRLKF